MTSYLKNSRTKYVTIIGGLVITMLMGTFLPKVTFAKSFSNQKPIIDVLCEKKVLSEDYKKYAQEVNQSVTDKGITVTINEVICDNTTMKIIYTIKSDKKLSDKPLNIMTRNVNSEVDGKTTGTSSGEYEGIIDEYTSAGVLEALQIYSGFPDKFNFKLDIDKIDNTEGKWNFSFLVSRDAIKKNTTSYKCNITSKIEDKEIKIKDVIFTQLNTTMSLEGKCIKQGCQHKNENFLNYDQWLLFDDKGNQLNFKNDHLSRIKNENKNLLAFEGKMNFDNVNEIPKSLTLIPYKHLDTSNKETNATVVKDLNSKYPIELSQGKVGSITIKNIEFLKDKTILHFSTKGIDPMHQSQSIFFVDENGEEIWSEYRFDLKANRLKSDDLLLEFPKLDQNKKYKIGTVNFDLRYEFRQDLQINIPLNK